MTAGHRRERFDRLQSVGIITLVILATAAPAWLSLGVVVGFIMGVSE